MSIAREVAEAEFWRFVETMAIQADRSKMNADDEKAFDDQRDLIVSAIESERLIVDDTGQPIFTPVKGDPIVFYEPTGATLMAADQKKKNADISKLYAMIGDMTKQPPARFAAMPMRDVKVCIALATLFLA